MQQLASTNQTSLNRGKCVHSISGSTAASVCGNKPSDSVVSAVQAQTGFDAILASCGSRNNYNGAHYADGLTFHIHGVAYDNPLIQSHNFPRGFTTDSDIGLARAVSKMDDICPRFQFTGISRYDCPNPARRCDDDRFDWPENNCMMYCEVRRTGFMGPESEAPAPYGQARPPGQDLQLQEGIETSVSSTIGAGLSATFLGAISLGINFECKASYPHRV